MKKIFALILVLVLSLSFAACTTEPADGNTTTTSKQTTVNNTDSTEFEKVLVVDNDICKIEIVGAEDDMIWGYTLKVAIENKSADTDYTFTVDDAVINGVQCDAVFYSDVAAGKKANEELVFTDDDLERNEIGKYTDIELTFNVSEADNWTDGYAVTKTVHVYPYGKDEAMVFDRGIIPTDMVLIDNEYVTIVMTDVDDENIWGYGINLYIVNKTDKEIMISADDASLNGIMIDPYYATTLLPGKCRFSTISWFDTDLDDNGITEVEEVEFKVRVYDNDDWFAADMVNEIVEFKVFTVN